MEHDPLALDAEEMRRIGHRTVDLLVERILADGPANRRVTPEELAARLRSGPPEQPLGFDAALEALERDVLPYAMRNDHPGFFGFIPTSPTWPGALADLVASALAICASSWTEAAGPSAVEVEVLRWFAEWIGYPPSAGGVLVSGGSAANLTALACARDAPGGDSWREAVGYVSDQCHSSIPRAARVLGLRPDQLRVLPTGPDHRLGAHVLAAAMDADARRGRRPLFVVANAGATNTGAVDPLREISDVCAERGAWLHADAAYGGFAVLTERGRSALAGLERADSVTLDPHKWLYQPWECGAVLVRDGERLRRTFTIVPDYLRETAAREGETNFADLGLQLSRVPRALKVWLSVSTFGLAAFRQAIDRSLDLADRARARIATYPHLELAATPSLSVTCLRRRFPEAADADEEDALNLALAAEVERRGVGLVTTTTLGGRTAIRLCVLNHATGPEHVDAVVDVLGTAVVSAAGAPEGIAGSDPRMLAWATLAPGPGAGLAIDDLRSVPLLADAPSQALERLAAVARRRTASPGECVVERHDSGTDFFLITAGEADVEVDGTTIATLGPGQFFGELAALDWGAGYGYARLATVVARTPLELVVLPDRTLELAMHLAPRLAHEVRERFFERFDELPR